MKTLFALTVAFLLAASAAHAEDKRVFDPVSGSYFELHKITKQESPSDYYQALNHAEAIKAAAKRTYKGVQGRLAVIKHPQTHQLIVTELQPTEHTWIGLTYICKDRSLRWVNGESISKRSFQAWHATWNQDPTASCGLTHIPRMGVAYSATNDGGGRWVAKGPAKRYSYYLVEYPTGKP